jgi:hypothetical protein
METECVLCQNGRRFVSKRKRGDRFAYLCTYLLVL